MSLAGAEDLCPQLSNLQTNNEHEVKRICFQFPFDLLVITLITGTCFNDFALEDIGESDLLLLHLQLLIHNAYC